MQVMPMPCDDAPEAHANERVDRQRDGTERFAGCHAAVLRCTLCLACTRSSPSQDRGVPVAFGLDRDCGT